MILCLGVGNTHIFAGVYINGKLQCQFKHPSSQPLTSDELAIVFKTMLEKNSIPMNAIKQVAICSVVPSLDPLLRATFSQHFSIQPFFLTADNAPDLKIGYTNPQEVGTDRISKAIAAIHQYPHKNLIVIDLGTATTFDVITANHDYLGGLILPGIYISMKALCDNTAKLAAVSIIKPDQIIGQSTTSNIQSGLYYGHLGAVREIIHQINSHYFQDDNSLIIGTGGYANLFENEGIFTLIQPELVLDGLYLANKYNQ